MSPRVLFCHPGAEMYGSDRMALETVRSLSASGMAVRLVLPGLGLLSSAAAIEGLEIRTASVPVLRKEYLRPSRLPGFIARSVRGLGTAISEIRQFRPDVVIANTITQPLFILAARLCGVPVICHVREAEDSLPRLVRAGIVAPLSIAQLIITNSLATERFVARSTLFRLPTTRVVYNGKDWSHYFRSEKKISDGPLRMVLVGRLSPRKGQDIAIRALAELRRRDIDASLHLLGDVFPGYEWYADDLRKLIASEGLQSSCRFAGFVEDVSVEIEASDLLLVPSRTEPFGTVAAEGMAAGRCVVVSDVQGLAEIVENQRSGVTVPSEDPRVWADTIADLVAEPGRVEAYATAGRQRVLEMFSTARYSDEMVAAVYDVVRKADAT